MRDSRRPNPSRISLFGGARCFNAASVSPSISPTPRQPFWWCAVPHRRSVSPSESKGFVIEWLPPLRIRPTTASALQPFHSASPPFPQRASSFLAMHGALVPHLVVLNSSDGSDSSDNSRTHHSSAVSVVAQCFSTVFVSTYASEGFVLRCGPSLRILPEQPYLFPPLRSASATPPVILDPSDCSDAYDNSLMITVSPSPRQPFLPLIGT